MKNIVTIKWIFILLGFFILHSCEDQEIEFRENFPFEVVVMPVREELMPGDTAEIRISIRTQENFQDTEYYLRYFQYQGHGELRYYDNNLYLPNDLYPLAQKEFRLYYTSASEETQNLSIWISDNFGNEKQLDFQFKSSE